MLTKVEWLWTSSIKSSTIIDINCFFGSILDSWRKTTRKTFWNHWISEVS
jgi:hypothetical protein